MSRYPSRFGLLHATPDGRSASEEGGEEEGSTTPRPPEETRAGRIRRFYGDKMQPKVRAVIHRVARRAMGPQAASEDEEPREPSSLGELLALLLERWKAEMAAALRPVVQAYEALRGTGLRKVLFDAARWAALLALAFSLAHVAANKWAVPALNERVLPGASQAITRILDREVRTSAASAPRQAWGPLLSLTIGPYSIQVRVGGVDSLSPLGLTGLTPVAHLSDVSVGPRRDGAERSHLAARAVSLGVSPLESLVQGKIVLRASVGGAEVHLVQGDNFSWFGQPMDTVPSARDFLPGLAGAREEQQQARVESHQHAGPSKG